jgi:membrane-bound lytic murein transglycosylase A
MRRKYLRYSLFTITACIGLSACSVIPSPNPATASTQVPAATPPPPTPSPTLPSVVTGSTDAAKPIPSRPADPLPAAVAKENATNAAGLGAVRGPQITALGITQQKAAAAMSAFRTSCPSLVKREDLSGLTNGADWVPACNAVKSWSGDALSFFTTHMDTVQIGDGKAFATGYYEPEILASRTKKPGFTVPIYKRPSDLVEVDLGSFSSDLKGRKVRGKLKGNMLVPYADRAAIEAGALNGRGLELAYAADPVEFFFLQVQGSGRLRMQDGTIMRIGYDNQNGHGYTGIGKLMKDRGLVAPGEATMQGLGKWLRANPVDGKKIMQENKSFVFFREETKPGPLGAMGYQVIPETSVAADIKYVPLGAPIWLSMDRAEPNGLWIAQDTGGAIKGSNRVDTFWGAGDRAVAIAGGMAARGSALLFLPKAAVARLIP